MPAAFYLPGFLWRYKVFFMELQGLFFVAFFMKDRHLDETNQIAPFVTSII